MVESLGFKVMLMGPSGTGKTHSIRTLAESGITPFCIFTDPNYTILLDLDCTKMHYTYVPPGEVSFDTLLSAAKSVSNLTVEKLAEQKFADKGAYTQFFSVIGACQKFKCDRCGQDFGAVDKFGLDRALVVDGLSGLSIMSRDLTVGSKPTMHPGEWGIAQHNVEKLVQKWASGMRTSFILIAHVEKEVDEVVGTSKLMASTLGRKLAPKLPWMFGDIILAVREIKDNKNVFTWTNQISGVDVKPRHLSLSNTHAPSFKPIVDAWRRLSGIGANPAPSPSAVGAAATPPLAVAK